MVWKLKERGVTLGKLLDVYDTATTPSSGPIVLSASVQTETEPVPRANVEQASVSTITTESTQVTHSQSDNDQNRPGRQSDEGSASIAVVNDTCTSTPIIVKGKHDPRSNFYRFDFTYEGVMYRSLEHAYQSIKAKICGYTSLAWDIKRASSPQAAKRLADRLPRMATKTVHDLMFNLLKAKVAQCYSFRRSLRETGSQKIFHSTYRNVDTYWCTGLDHRDIEGHLGEFDGLNVFGQMLEKVRDEHLQSEHEYETKVQYLEADTYVVLLYDGEDNLYPSDFYGDSDFYRRGSGYHRYHH
jgi:ribA/ribD-fused uncharacterized protein